MARPTKLTKELIAKARQYNYKDGDEAVPTIEGLSLFLRVARSSVYLWADEDSELGAQFSDIVNGYLAEQSKILITNGLKGKFNANITRLILSGKHGYVEKQSTDLTTNGKDLPVPILGGISQKGGDEKQ